MAEQFQIIENNEIISAKNGFSNYTIPKEVKGIKNGTETSYAFKNVQNEFTVDFEEGSELTYIGSYAFYKRSKLKSINFENAKNLTIIYKCAFSECTSLISITFPSSLQELRGWGAFISCSNLQNVTFLEDSELQFIDIGSFQSTGLKTFHVPSDCYYIRGESFGNTDILEFTVAEDNMNFQVYNKSLFTYGYEMLVFQARGSEMQLHENTTKIGYCAFKGYELQSTLTFPTRIVEFEEAVFYGYYGNTLIFNCPINITSIRMFEYCPNLKRIYFNNELDIINGTVFKSTNSLRSIYLSNPITEIINTNSFTILNKICFSGYVESVQQALPGYSIKDCFHLVQTCDSSTSSPTICNALITLIFIGAYK